MSEELFSTTQWVVTDDGLYSQRPGGRYLIGRASIADEAHDATFGAILDWPVHLAKKHWVDLDDLLQALEYAIGKWAPYTTPGMLARSFEAARAHRASF